MSVHLLDFWLGNVMIPVEFADFHVIGRADISAPGQMQGHPRLKVNITIRNTASTDLDLFIIELNFVNRCHSKL